MKIVDRQIAHQTDDDDDDDDKYNLVQWTLPSLSTADEN